MLGGLIGFDIYGSIHGLALNRSSSTKSNIFGHEAILFRQLVGRDKAMIRAYIQSQEKVDQEFDRQFNLNLAV